MLNVLIAGCGNIGSRHLQSLKLSGLPLCIYAYDPNEASLNKAKTIWESTKGTPHVVHFTNDLTNIPNTIFAAVIATNSANRLAVFKLIAENFTVKHFVLEKFLFPEVKEFNEAQNVIDQLEATVEVNCPRRLFEPYHFLKNECAAQIYSIEIKGNNWGLCSNSIHFIDLINFLSDKLPTACSLDIGSKFIPSKREGYTEIIGKMKCSFDGLEAIISCDEGDFSGMQITIITEESTYLIEEKNNVICIYKNGEPLHEGKMKFQSELTSTYLEAMYAGNKTGLTPYENSSPMHLIFLKAVHSLAQELNYTNEIKIS